MDKEELNGCSAGCTSCSGCGHDHGEFMGDIDPVITLTDEEGKEVKFEIIDVVVLDDEREFLVVADADKEDTDKDVEVTILEIKEDNGEEVYDTVTDEELANKVFDEFMKNQDDSEIEE